jgi:hypothetical protein
MAAQRHSEAVEMATRLFGTCLAAGQQVSFPGKRRYLALSSAQKIPRDPEPPSFLFGRPPTTSFAPSSFRVVLLVVVAIRSAFVRLSEDFSPGA